MCNSIESCIEKKSIVKDSSFIYDEFTYVYQRYDMIEYSHIKSIGELSYNGKCGINCLYCKDGNTCMKCRDGDYTMGSNSKTRGNTKKLFCDLVSNFEQSTNYELDNEIYYIIDENQVTDTYDNEQSGNDDNEVSGNDDNEQSGSDHNKIEDGNNINNNNEISKLSESRFVKSKNIVNYMLLLLINF
jgi:hypothetical protein